MTRKKNTPVEPDILDRIRKRAEAAPASAVKRAPATQAEIDTYFDNALDLYDHVKQMFGGKIPQRPRPGEPRT